MELAGAVEERKRLTATLELLNDIKSSLNEIRPLLYQDIPLFVEESRKIKFLGVVVAVVLCFVAILNVLILIKSF